MSEEMVIRNCAPTLAGLKTGSLFACPFDSWDTMCAHIRALNRSLSPKGLRCMPLRWTGNRALIYVYRPGRLKRDLSEREAAGLLRRLGYPCGNLSLCLVTLMRRLREAEEFPHEIGLFLGYPTEDVAGFIENRAKNCKCCGCWKVYGDEAKARRTFDRYHKCTDAYCELWRRGVSLGELTRKDPS